MNLDGATSSRRHSERGPRPACWQIEDASTGCPYLGDCLLRRASQALAPRQWPKCGQPALRRPCAHTVMCILRNNDGLSGRAVVFAGYGDGSRPCPIPHLYPFARAKRPNIPVGIRVPV
jgi:hypothetical protein